MQTKVYIGKARLTYDKHAEKIKKAVQQIRKPFKELHKTQMSIII